MPCKPDRPYPLRWSGGYFKGPVWPSEREPNIDAVRSLAKNHLQELAKGPLIDTSLEVSFFAEGAYNKLFQISAPELESSYLLRATLPVEPYFKTESEVATIAFLRANTAIPVPRIIAWQSNLDGDLGSEWILMEKLEGATLLSVWRKLPWERKLSLVEEVAKLMKELQSHRFDKIGSLYFKSALEDLADEHGHLLTATLSQDRKRTDNDHDAVATGMSKEIILDQHHEKIGISKGNVAARAQGCLSVYDHESAAQPPVSSENPGAETHNRNVSREKTALGFVKQKSGGAQLGTLEKENSESFAIGRIFDPNFFRASRYYRPGDRGPYRCTMEWLSAMIRFQLQWIKDGPIEDDDEYGSDFEEEVPKMQRYCNKYLDVLPQVFANEEAELPYTLYHHDLNASNIIVNPETFDVIGIVDWEMVNIVPKWRAALYPEFLDFAKPFTGEVSAPPIPDSYDDEDDIAIEKRDRWDFQILRDHWEATMKRLKKDNEVHLDPSEIRTKNEYLYELTNLTDMWNWSRIWLYHFETGTKDLPPDDDSDQDSPKRKKRSKKDMSQDLASSQNVLAKEGAGNEVSETSDVTVPAPLVADVNRLTKEQLIPTTIHPEHEDAAFICVATPEEPKSNSSSEAARTECLGKDEQEQEIRGRNTVPTHLGTPGSRASPSADDRMVKKDGYPEAERCRSGSKQQDVVLTERGNLTEAEGLTSSNVSEAGTEHESSAERVAKMEGMPVSSNVPEAGSEHTPLVGIVEDYLKEYCSVS